MTANKELKPCPFCGSEACGGWLNDHDYYVNCVECDVGFLESTPETAIELWNRRVDNKITKFDDKEDKEGAKSIRKKEKANCLGIAGGNYK